MIDRERFERLDELLDAALVRPADQRQSFLRAACRDDEELCREALRLLELAEAEDEDLQPGGGADLDTWEEAAKGEEEPARAVSELASGQPVGPYRVIGLIARGGMGQVYEAEDPKLGRRVALKVLPPELDTAERRRRFEREARALASLNHPNIVHIYSIEESDGVHYIAMERVFGRTLADLIGPGGLPLERLLGVAVPLADALAAAHARGVVHRDLKPANVMVGDDGQVKVLDFGVAKTKKPSELEVSDSSWGSREGLVVGTSHYMSPEQAEGREVDPRSDIFALGVTLFQASTGELPFPGASLAAVLSSILNDTPPAVTDLKPDLPADLARLVRRCLAKDPERRYQTATEVRNELEALRRRLGGAAPRPGRWLLLGGTVAAAAIVAAGVLLLSPSRRAPALEGTFTALTADPGPELFPSLSPDGQYLAYCGRESARWSVYLLRVGGQRPIRLTVEPDEDDVQPAFSPDGHAIAFRSSRSGGGIFLMGATGESARRLTDRGWNPTWSPDGSEVAFATQPVFDSPYDRPTASELWAVRVDNGATRRIAEGDAVQPSWSPHGYRLAYWGLPRGGSRRDIWTVPAAGGLPVPVTEDEYVDWSPAWAPDGRYLYFSSDRGGSMNLWRVAIDEQSGRVTGEPERITTPAAFAHHATFSRDGRRLAYVSSSLEQELHRVAFDPVAGRIAGSPLPVARELRRLNDAHVSPDGQWVVYCQTDPQEDLLLSRIDGSARRTLTDDVYRDRRPRFSPDGRRIAFYSNRSGHYEVWTVEPDGSHLVQLTRDPQRRNARYPIWSPDGSMLLFSRAGVTGEIIDPAAGKDAPPLRELPPYSSTGEYFVPLDWSRDGRLIAGMLMSPAGERSGLAIFDLEENAYRKVLDHGTWPAWLPDSRRLVFQAPPRSGRPGEGGYPRGESLFIVDVEVRQPREILALPEVTLGPPILSPDGRWLLFLKTVVKADVWMLTIDTVP